jgi:para-nitrobenzyl esterase
MGDGPPQDLADTMHGAWVAFITNGDPGWPPYRADDPVTMVWDETPKVVHDLLGSVRDCWPSRQ